MFRPTVLTRPPPDETDMSNLMATADDDAGTKQAFPTLPPTLVPGADLESVSAAPLTAPMHPAPTGQAFLWLRRGDQIVVWLLITALLILLGIHWLRLSRWGNAPVELRSQQPREYYYSLDINTASWVEWSQLDGIGEKLARRIVADRDEHGPFRNPADVSRVKGIGPKLMDKIGPFLKGGTEKSGF